jgi:hypothetical protein
MLGCLETVDEGEGRSIGRVFVRAVDRLVREEGDWIKTDLDGTGCGT